MQTYCREKHVQSHNHHLKFGLTLECSLFSVHYSLSTELVNELKKVACEPQQGPKRLRLLCATILREVIPTSQLNIDNVEPPIEEKWIPIIFPLVWVQVSEATIERW